ncbi:MAG TPA: type II secretion system protein [Candidatus Saccharimonadales bacterium]|jgi:prepilin-type N-terminal cleavage/methylation domain-containing protein
MNANTKLKKASGFTIIEVVLVLAIAGLIFLIVFLALPALQRSQRDTQRRSDVGRVVSQITQFQSNSNGAVPPATAAGFANSFVPTYMNAGGDTFQDPRGNTYNYVYGAGAAANGNAVVGTSRTSEIRYATSARCGAGGAITGGGNTRQVAVSIGLEGGGAYCTQN